MNKIYAVGIGPGSYEEMTVRAVRTLEKCDVILGYTVYVDLLREHFPGKELLTTPMKQEEKRCRMAFEQALLGRQCAVVCSGDAGVYGMAGLLFQLSGAYPGVEIEVVPGVTAALSGGALLGAPLGHDFAVISLSDLLTPWDAIASRIAHAAAADLCICLYNPSSKKRGAYLGKACDIMLEHKQGDTLCGIARNIGRQGETYTLLTLSELRDTPVDMFTTVFIGNVQTAEHQGRMVTPRGYRL